MSMKSSKAAGVAEETKKIAKAAFPKGNVYLWMRDELRELYEDGLFVDLYPDTGQPALAPGRLALVVILQFMEGLSDRQAAEAVRARIDWKYALGLGLDDPGFDYSVLSEFRARLGRSPEKQSLLNVFLNELLKRGWIKDRGKQRTDSTHVLAAIRSLNRLERVGETLRRALNELAETDPDWVQATAKPEWYPRYAQRMETLRLPKKVEAREQLTLEIGQDGFDLMEALWAAEGKEELRQLPGVEILHRIWIQQYWMEDSGGDDGHMEVRLRADDNQPPGEQRIHSPYDVEARYRAKRFGEWVGYKVTLTETCDEQLPHIITNVETTSAVEQAVSLTERIHQSLQDKQLLPTEHLMDSGFIDAELLVGAQANFGVTIWGPVKKDVRWQANQADGFSLSDFQIHWEQRTVTCPPGKTASAWSEQTPLYHTVHGCFPYHTTVYKGVSPRVPSPNR